jgi:ATP-dependent exoDNAse (exonuclease V) beta subunit
MLVHAVLAQAPFDAPPADRLALTRLEARLLGVTDDQVDAAAALVERLFAHDLLERARAADARGACRRETPVTCTLPDGLIVEGIVDLAFEEEGKWTVVDYKTDRELAAVGEDRYRRQVALYASAISQATGRPATGVLVRV